MGTQMAKASRLGLLATLIALAACSAPKDVTWHEETGVRWRALEVPKGTPGFTTIDAGKTGIRFQNNASDKILLGNRMLAQGAGVSLGDVDGDGLTDIFLAR